MKKMKKINKYLILLLSIAAFVACDDDNNGLGEENPESGWLQFDGTDPAATFINDDLINDQISSVDIPFRFTAPINTSSITLDYVISDVQGTSSDILTSSSGSATIPANNLNGTITLNIDLANLAFNLSNTYIFDVIMQSNDRSVGMGLSPDYASSFEVTIKRCDVLALAGMYSVSTTYVTHDFLPDFSSHTMDAEIFDAGNGQFSVTDITGGLYSVGPYVAAYGTSQSPLTFSELCENITWTGQSDYWGPVVPTTGGVNSVDPDTGVITISWFCEGYSEEGVSIYTPL